MKVGVVIAAAGSGRRMGGERNKILLPLEGRPMIAASLELFDSLEEVSEIVVVTRKEDLQKIEEIVEATVKNTPVQVVLGGETRQKSVYCGLQAFNSEPELALIHDGARPYIKGELVRQILQEAKKHGAAAVGVPVKDTIKQVQEGLVLKTLPREELWAVQTPQVFSYSLILKAHQQAESLGLQVTDDCSLLEKIGHPVRILPGDYENVKITTPEDLPAQALCLVGFGWDAHRLTENRSLILCGVEIPHNRGLLGHSDADVAVHALMDALLGALGRGDIGELFPDSDPRFKDISSLTLLSQVMELVQEEGLRINNIDLTILAERPKLAEYKESMRSNLASVLEIPKARINLKASTAEGMGFIGRGEGIAAQAGVILSSRR